ncbi:hypothetical protein VF14_23960 [Nostoc linckia z18]|uniref:UbiA family prenyltransferase n=3 Tax=Nostoc linckia TaxID=92942 RepID=A0A9Q5Z9D3_NOSLI|nr:hypothetical protein VF02_31865 [Nostoc linckia z1]PHJ58740.1 hypothetical protein VF05_33265 [Nostoc linckia z3]PHJ62548.1 hypothetical protein VF03_31165 [Nostoc linckia z2]PHJ75464.1 hypothetical protein VF06_33185 [Nostoc linckia z4]PHJ80090.1 hypothetical protein VF07_32815 [Nostoc linckia z6]PHJ93537.1 hypothetical protein VF04_25405 [Nostoc linckia z7]PHK01026.1 hypothetical protein VF08_23060 [Nostoc linckia z8]PHK04154.1 hypothetical protein VF09_28875 [Nostoc linckia z9]PHK1811
MTRPGFSNAAILMSVAGLLSFYKTNPPYTHVAGLAIVIGMLGSSIVILNDLLDQDDDEVTAPYLPLPAGLLNRDEAKLGFAILITLCLICLNYVIQDPFKFLSASILVVIALLTSAAYCIFKNTGFLASLLMSVPYIVFALIGYIVGDGNIRYITTNLETIVVVISSFLISFSGNILAGLRDIDKDPLVGNQTLPVRLGSQRAFKLVVFLAAIDSALVAWLAIRDPKAYYSLPILVIALVLMGISFLPILRTYGEADRGRVQRMSDMKMWLLGKDIKLIALVSVFSLPIGLALGIGLRLLRLFFQKGYKKQIIDGGLSDILATTNPLNNDS